MPTFSLSIRRYATNEAGCGASFTFSGGWAEIAESLLAVLPGNQLISIIGKLVATGNAQVPRFQLCDQLGEDAELEVAAS